MENRKILEEINRRIGVITNNTKESMKSVDAGQLMVLNCLKIWIEKESKTLGGN